MYWLAQKRAKSDGNLRGPGNLSGIGDLQPNSFRPEAVYGHSLIIDASPGMYQEIYPYWAISIDSIRIKEAPISR